MSARRMPCKRCHHPKPVGTDGYCASCAEILRRLKLPKSVPPSAGGEGTVMGDSNELAPGTIIAIDSPKITLPDGVDSASLACVSSPAMAGDRVVPEDSANAGVAGGEPDPITERSSKIPTLPPTGAPVEPLATFGNDHSPGETVTYVAKGGDPDLAVLVGASSPPSPLLEGATVSVTAVQVDPLTSALLGETAEETPLS